MGEATFYLFGDVVTGGIVLPNRYVKIEDGLITEVTDERKENAIVYQVGGYICPGFIDVHIHGVDGFDFMDEEEFVLDTIASKLPKYGVTSFLATSRTAPVGEVMAFLKRASQVMEGSGNKTHGNARLLGVHVEGPWISSTYKGAQPEAYIRKLTWQDVQNIIEPYRDIICKITIAPEEVTDDSIIEYLTDLGIQLSAGHTDATLEELESAMKYGLNQITHTFNAMSPLHHREPGVVGAAMYYPELFCELIADGLHVHPKVIQLLYRIKGKERLALISDCTGYNHLADGNYHYHLRNKHLVKSGNRVMLESGNLAGSAVTLIDCIQFAVKECDIPLVDAIYMATEVPLGMISESRNIGKVAPGFKADLVLLDKELNIKQTFIDGVLYDEGGK